MAIIQPLRHNVLHHMQYGRAGVGCNRWVSLSRASEGFESLTAPGLASGLACSVSLDCRIAQPMPGRANAAQVLGCRRSLVPRPAGSLRPLDLIRNQTGSPAFSAVRVVDSMFGRIWEYLAAILDAFIADDALSRGASISFYTVTSIGPVLFIVVAIAGLAFGEDAARGAVSEQLSNLMGKESAEMVQKAVQSASGKSAGIIASIIGVITLIITASGVFGEMQSALNVIWKAEPHGSTVSRLVRARAASLGKL